jgi:capsular polysaccharide transport system permease protein
MPPLPRLPHFKNSLSQARKRIGRMDMRARLPDTIRDLRPPGAVTAIVARTAETLDGALASGGGGLYWKSFLALVIIPMILFFLYSALWQSTRYVSETRVSVRAAQETKAITGEGAGLIGKLMSGGGGARSTIQDAYIVLNYIKSPAILRDLGGAAAMQRYFSLSGADYFSRLSKGDFRIEDLLKYWLSRVAASVDTVSSIVTVKVEAFQPQEAQSLAQEIVRLSETLVNNMSLRSRQDAVARAEREVSLAADKLAAAREKLTVFRNQGALIDPGSKAKSVSESIAKLTMEKIDIENSLSVLQDRLDADSPTQRIQKSKLQTIERQIAELKKTLTDSNSNEAVSSQIASFERLKLEEAFTESIYKISVSAFQRARQELEKQQLYLVVVVPPTLPESAAYPKPVVDAMLLFLGLSILWGIGALIAASIGDQMV